MARSCVESYRGLTLGILIRIGYSVVIQIRRLFVNLKAIKKYNYTGRNIFNEIYLYFGIGNYYRWDEKYLVYKFHYIYIVLL